MCSAHFPLFSLNHWQRQNFHYIHVLSFSESHIVRIRSYVAFSDRLLLLSTMHSSFSLSFHVLIIHFFYGTEKYFIIWICHSLLIYLPTERSSLPTSFGNYEWSLYKHHCGGFCVDVLFLSK